MPAWTEVGFAQRTLGHSFAKRSIAGLFVIRGNAKFVPVTTGIIGVTDIEVLNGVNDRNQIVTESGK